MHDGDDDGNDEDESNGGTDIGGGFNDLSKHFAIYILNKLKIITIKMCSSTFAND